MVACILQQLTEKDKEKDKDNQFQANWARTLFQARQLSGALCPKPNCPGRAQFAWTTNLICECVAGTLQQRKDQPAAVYQPESELLNKGKI